MHLTTLGHVLTWAEQSFQAAGLYYGHGTNNAWDESVVLALSVLKLPPTVDASVIDRVLTKEEKENLLNLIQRRIDERIPAPYLTHEAWFADLKFYVDQRVIIPRSPMAELILKGFQPWIGQRTPYNLLDLCTGSACLAIAAAMQLSQVQVDAIDISTEALAVAAENVSLHGCEDRVHLIASDLFQACPPKRYDIIMSNPPYVDKAAIEALPKEYEWEPHLALAAGHDGLEIVKKILREAPRFLNERGLLFVEVGASQAALQDQYPEVPFTWLDFERGGEGVFLLTKEELVCWPVF